MSKQFHIGDVLSITTGKLLAPSGMDGIYSILNYMTNDNLFTHQLPRAMRECAPYLARQYPDLPNEESDLPDFNGSKEAVTTYVQQQAVRFGEYLEVEPIPQDDHTYKDPITEAMELTSGRVIVVDPNNEH